MTLEPSISPAFPYSSNYMDVLGSKIHYIDEGEGDPILFLHGNPTSSYLWRNILPYLSNNARCIAPDLIGMGKSDKPDIDYGFHDTYRHLEAFIDQLGISNITLVIHDWGSALGFHYANTHRANIKGIAFMEAMYREIDLSQMPLDIRVSMSLMRTPGIGWTMVMLGNVFITQMLPKAIVRTLTPEEQAAYAAPFKRIKSRKPVLLWPQEIPMSGTPRHTSEVVHAYHAWLKETPIPKLCLYSEPGMIIQQEDANWIGANFPNTEIVNVGAGLHFIQEDQPHAIGRRLATWYATISEVKAQTA